MTYSQRLSGEVSLSDIIYMEHQLETVKEELRVMMEEREGIEDELIYLKALPAGSVTKDGSDEQSLMMKLSHIQTVIRSLSDQMEHIEEALAKIGD